MRAKMTALAFLAVTAGVFFFTRTTNVPPSDLRDAVADDGNSQGFNTSIPVFGNGNGNLPVPKAAVPAEAGASGISKDYAAASDPAAGGSLQAVEWVAINGGKFMMGTASGEKGFENTKPIHEVAIKTFMMSKTEVTVEQYAECVAKGQCSEPRTGDRCNWEVAGRQLHPVNCVDWGQANKYAKFKGARLPSESEWEYAAKSGGKDQKYPWGDEAPTGGKAVMCARWYAFARFHTMPACSKTAGNTAQGLCDMAGNVAEWVKDEWRNSYAGAPADGSAFEQGGFGYRVIRGGSFYIQWDWTLRADYRSLCNPIERHPNVGFRLVRSNH